MEITKTKCDTSADYKQVKSFFPFLTGGSIVARDREKLRLNGITHVLNCAGDVCANYLENELDGEGKKLIQYKQLFLLDSNAEDITCVFYEGMFHIQNFKKLIILEKIVKNFQK